MRRVESASAARRPSRGVGGRGTEADDGGHVLQPAAALALLRPADDERRDPQAAADEQRAGTLRAAELVRGDAEQVGAERGEVDRDVAGAGAGVDVDEHAPARAASQTSATGCSVPTSWLASCTDTRAVSSVMAAAISSGSKRPSRSTPTSVSSPGSRRQASRTLECSTAVVTMSPPSPARRTPPQIAWFTASVPLEVKTTSRGRAPKSSATCSRACSTATRVTRPSACSRAGSPWCSARNGSIASSAAGRSGDDDAWSR